MLVIQYKKGTDWIKLDPFYVNVWAEFELNAVSFFGFEYPIANKKTEDLQPRTEIKIFENNNLIVGGYIERKETIVTNAELLVKFTCQNYLVDFVNEITVPNKAFINENITDLLNPLYSNTIIKPSGWSSIVEPTSEKITYLSSLQSIMSLFKQIGRQTGFNFRYAGTSANPKTVEFGQFGNSNSFRIRQKPTGYTSIKNDLLVIDENGFVEVIDAGGVINQVYPLGGGGDNGINQLTLRDVEPSSIVSSYPIYIDTETPNNDTIYNPLVFNNAITGCNTYRAFYLKDDASQAKHGKIKRAVTFNDIYPLSSNGQTFTDADRKLAANQLYKAARFFLINHSQPHITYRFACFGNAANLKVGDKINFRYKGEIKKINENSSSSFVYADLNVNFYIVSLKITWGKNGEKRYNFNLSNYPRRPSSELDVLAHTIETLNDATRQRKGSVTTYPVYFEDSFDNFYPAEFLYWIPPQTVFIDYIQLKVRIKPFRAYEKAILGGGAVVGTSSAGGGSTQTTAAGGNHTHTITIPSHTHDINAMTTQPEGTGITAHQHTISMFTTGATTATTHTNLYNFFNCKYLMVQPDTGSTHGPCSSINGGRLIVSDTSASDDINRFVFKTNCTISGHSHVIDATTTAAGGAVVVSSNASGDHTHTITIPDHVHTITLPDHTHAIEFGIFQDTTPASGIKIFIDGIDFSSQLGTYSSFGDFPSPINENFDLLAAASNLGVINTVFSPGAHTIQVKCNHGRAKVQLFLYNQFYLSSK